jgi:hypothetical protein
MSKILFRAAIILLLISVGGCGLHRSAGDLARVSPRDHKSHVLYRLGTPTAAESKDGSEMLYYDLLNRDGAVDEYYVKLSGGYVESYGKVTDDEPEAAGSN